VVLRIEDTTDQDTPDQFYNNSLAYYLCEGAGNLTNNTTIILSHTIIHHIPPGSFCLVENVTHLTIYGDSSDNPAVVKCNSTSHHVRGFGFFNIANLSISNIIIENCGGVIDQDATKYINSSLFYFQPGQRAVFLFNHCFDLTLNCTEIREYKGFAVVGANMMGRSSLTKTVLNSNEENCTAVGAFIFYVESKLLHRNGLQNSTTTLTISECNVFSCVVHPPVYNFTLGFNSISRAGGVTVAFSQQSYFVHIHVQQSNFSVGDSEQGSVRHGLLLLYVLRDLMSKVTIDNECIFKGHALDVLFYFRTDFVNLKNMIGCSSSVTICATEIKNSMFQNTIISISTLLTQQDLTNNYNFTKFFLNNDKILNSSVYAQSNRGIFILEMNKVQFLCNASMMHIGLDSFSISGSSESESHFVLAAISVIDTDVHLSGSLSFKNSSLILEGTSHLVLQEPLSAMFVDKFSEVCLSVARSIVATDKKTSLNLSTNMADSGS